MDTRRLDGMIVPLVVQPEQNLNWIENHIYCFPHSVVRACFWASSSSCQHNSSVFFIISVAPNEPFSCSSRYKRRLLTSVLWKCFKSVMEDHRPSKPSLPPSPSKPPPLRVGASGSRRRRLSRQQVSLIRLVYF